MLNYQPPVLMTIDFKLSASEKPLFDTSPLPLYPNKNLDTLRLDMNQGVGLNYRGNGCFGIGPEFSSDSHNF